MLSWLTWTLTCWIYIVLLILLVHNRRLDYTLEPWTISLLQKISIHPQDWQICWILPENMNKSNAHLCRNTLLRESNISPGVARPAMFLTRFLKFSPQDVWSFLAQKLIPVWKNWLKLNWIKLESVKHVSKSIIIMLLYFQEVIPCPYMSQFILDNWSKSSMRK